MEPTDRRKYDPRIDVLRAFACGMVAVVHFSVPTWTDAIVEEGFILDTVALGLIHTGWLGVPLFLFLSGYSLALNKTKDQYELDKKQFFINRILRIFPAWVTCILILSFTHQLSGIKVFTLLLLQTQDLPPANAFNLTWSLQLEFMCYLIFPIMLTAVAARKRIMAFYIFFLLVRIWMFMMPTTAVMQLSYTTVFGGGTIFLTGILAASLNPIRNTRTARVYLASGIVLFCAIAVYVWKSGGYQRPDGIAIHWFFLVMPEILSATVFLIVRGALAQVPTVLAAEVRGPLPIVRMMNSARSALFKVFAHFGRVSYSAYVFSLFTLDFTSRVFGFIEPSGWISMFSAWAIYFSALTVFSTASFYGIELPFLQMRRQYVRAGATDR